MGTQKPKSTGKYQLPGGNLEFGEDIFACVQRETLEETGLAVRAKKVIAYTNDVQKEEQKHEVTLYVLCEREDASQQPEVCPPWSPESPTPFFWGEKKTKTAEPPTGQRTRKVRGLGVEGLEGHCGHGRGRIVPADG